MRCTVRPHSHVHASLFHPLPQDSITFAKTQSLLLDSPGIPYNPEGVDPLDTTTTTPQTWIVGKEHDKNVQ